MWWFAEAAASSGGIGSLFTALGLNLKGLALNAVAFGMVVWLMGKFVYPHLIKALDRKQDELEATARHEQEARAALEKARTDANALLVQARTSADEIVATARTEAADQLETARTKAEAQAERLMLEAREQVARDVRDAREELKAETAKLVAAATETVLGEKLTSERDAALIGRSLEGR